MDKFNAVIDIIGINPFVLLPDEVLANLFKQAERDKGPIPVHGLIDGHPYIQTLVKYSGAWRLYINTPMLKAANRKVGDETRIEIEFDGIDRSIPMHPKLEAALEQTPDAKAVFDSLPPSRRKEIVRYITSLKSADAVERNVDKAVRFLMGKERFVGRDKP
ncbi:MAG: hypothetical protein K0S09_3094 [Sphingobacteriaceae bacterium]|jgi:hypothetical protein|nr:hypothetical protein [Sphingobacteriaceae bacterium]